MRLIDADSLELKHYVQRVSDKVIRYNGTQPQYANYDILVYDIANAPTVEAIPIEWLEKWFTEKHKRAIIWWDCAEGVFKAFMEDWRKENGRKKNDSEDDNAL